MAECHLESWRACLTDFGSARAINKEGWIHSWMILSLALVIIGWILSGLARSCSDEFGDSVADDWGWSLDCTVPELAFPVVVEVALSLMKDCWGSWEATVSWIETVG